MIVAEMKLRRVDQKVQNFLSTHLFCFYPLRGCCSGSFIAASYGSNKICGDLSPAKIAYDHLGFGDNRVDVIRPPLQHLCPLLRIFRTIVDAGNAAFFMA
jgi:hypothetical protein